jgi:hypothetical protein
VARPRPIAGAPPSGPERARQLLLAAMRRRRLPGEVTS